MCLQRREIVSDFYWLFGEWSLRAVNVDLLFSTILSDIRNGLRIRLALFYLYIITKSHENTQTNNSIVLLTSIVCVAKAWYHLCTRVIELHCRHKRFPLGNISLDDDEHGLCSLFFSAHSCFCACIFTSLRKHTTVVSENPNLSSSSATYWNSSDPDVVNWSNNVSHSRLSSNIN